MLLWLTAGLGAGPPLPPSAGDHLKGGHVAGLAAELHAKQVDRLAPALELGGVGSGESVLIPVSP